MRRTLGVALGLAGLMSCVQGDVVVAERCPGALDYTARTEDGATIALHRHPAQGPPVLVVHGISSNHSCWDLSPDRSLAVALAEAGFDAWLLDLRGHGSALDDDAGRRQWWGWSIDDYGLKDIPAAITLIQQTTGAARVHYVGHSLGGMVGAAWAGAQPGADQILDRLVAVGSPMDFSDPDPLVAGALALARGPVPLVPTDLMAEFQARLGPDRTSLDKLVDAALFNDVSPEMRGEMYRRVSSPMTGGELRQLGDAGLSGSFLDQEGARDYRQGLENVHAPTLVIAGRADHIAPVDRVYAYYLSSGAADKRFVIAGRYTGFAADYGHLDLTIGDHAAAEIYPLIVDWLRH